MASGKRKKSKGKQPGKRSGIWCIGLSMTGGIEKTCVFNGHEEARLFLYSALDGVLEDLDVLDANMWEM